MTKELLIAARALIENPENWIQESEALDKAGQEVNPAKLEAVCYCSIGCVYAAASKSGVQGSHRTAVETIKHLTELVEAAHKCYSLAGFNDTHTHAEVLALFDKAIEAEK